MLLAVYYLVLFVVNVMLTPSASETIAYAQYSLVGNREFARPDH